MNNEDYVSYNLAVALKDAGFDWECDSYYDSHRNLYRYATSDRVNRNTNGHHTPSCSAPSLVVAQKWLRKKGVEVEVTLNKYDGRFGYDWAVILIAENDCIDCNKADPVKTYEGALENGIATAVGLIIDGEL